jgi:hypothetical protein
MPQTVQDFLAYMQVKKLEADRSQKQALVESLQHALADSASSSTHMESKLQERTKALEGELTRVRLANHRLKEEHLEESAHLAVQAFQKPGALPSSDLPLFGGAHPTL